MNDLSIIIACHNDSDIHNTIASIRETAGDAPQIIVVDDASAKPIASDRAKVIRTARRIGVGPARTLGAIAAQTEYLLFCDAHMRFTQGWYQAAMERIVGRATTLHCAMMLGLDDTHTDVNHPAGRYCGATLNVYGDDPNVRGKKQVMEVNWLRSEQADDVELPCVCGACYFWPREWFLKLNPLAFLRHWGNDEESMSVKAWLSGGDVRFLKTVQIGHKFRGKKQRIPYVLNHSDTLYNRLFLMHTVMPPSLYLALQKKMQCTSFQVAIRRLYEDYHLVEVERARNQESFIRDFYWFASKFNIPLPTH